MLFEYDRWKNEANIAKHGISFEEAQEVWDDTDLIVLHARKRGEKRMLAIGRICTMLCSVIYTKRGDAIRIISACKASSKEVKLYEQNKGE